MTVSARYRPTGAALALLTALLCAGTAGAGDRDLAGRWGLGLEFGSYKLLGGEHDYSTVDQFGGLNLSRGLSREWTLQLAVRYGYVRPGIGSPGEGDVGWSGTSGAPLYTPMVQPMLRLQRRFAATSSVQPFLGAGVGLTSWKVVDKTGQDVGTFPDGDPALGYDSDGNAAELEGSDLTLGLELGVDFALGDHWALTLGGRYHFLPSNTTDNVGASSLWGPQYVDANNASAEGFLGLTWWFGSNDRDGDGVPNTRDACPDEAEDQDGFRDDDGCPDLDNDGDGITDSRDGCPDQAEDRDGFQDGDGCPDPDNDGDGIVDAKDRCPDEAEDQDGFQDEDGCPDADNDGDGVLDAADRCPDTPAGVVVGADGCEQAAAVPAPVVPVAAAAVLPVAGQTMVLGGVTFQSSSARLLPESTAKLDQLALALRANAEAVVELRGHTDSVGASEVNRDLSQRRAMAVRDALIQRGIEPRRVNAVGYGEDFPIAGNDTAEGRARNRRVELHRLQ